MMKYIKLLSRIVLGTVFIFSGFVKAVDPLGSAYKFSDYLGAFGMGFLESTALPLGVLLSAFELVLGITLILGYRRKTVYPVLMWFMSFFTLLTFVLAIFNPVSDCGCFGDALILTNWQTFLKNLVLMAFVLVLYLGRKAEREKGKPVTEWIIVFSLFAGITGFSLWNHRHLPLLDFRPYGVGTDIQEAMTVPAGAPVDIYETTLIYRNRESGRTEAFTIENYPKDTLAWEFETSESKLVSKGDEPSIHDFAIMDPYGTDIVEEMLADRGYSLLMISHDIGEANETALVRAQDWSRLEILADDFAFYAVTASPGGEVNSVSVAQGLGYPFYSADDIMLKTMIRSNPGFILIKNGSIIGKWGFRDFPAIGTLDPEWNEMIGNASAPMDEEAQMLMEAGVFEEFSYDVLEFDRITDKLIFKADRDRHEKAAVIIFILSVLLLGVSFSFIAPVGANE